MVQKHYTGARKETMVQKQPLFSIIIPVYNREDLIKATINSVLEQSFVTHEIIVVNDGSTDRTRSVIDEYGAAIRIIDQENSGAEVARNSGAEVAKGEYLVFLDSDDILLPGSFSIYQQIIEKENKPALIFAKGDGFKYESQLNRLKHLDQSRVHYYCFKDYLSKKESTWLSTSFLILKRSLWNKKIHFRSGTFPVDDLDFMLRIGTVSPCLLIRQPATVGYRYHEKNSIRCVAESIEKLRILLKFEQKREYPGGIKRKLDRLALIGGHVVEWSFRGIRGKIYGKSLLLLLGGAHSVFAGLMKKALLWLLPKSEPSTL